MSFELLNPKKQGVKIKLELNDEIVYLKGLTRSERCEAPVSLVRGALIVVVKSKLVHVDKVQIKFMGNSCDIIYNRSLCARCLRESDKKIIIDDSYEFDLHPFELIKGVYKFPFQFILEPDLPETIFTCLGNRHYFVETKLIFKDKTELITSKPVKIVRCPLEYSLLLAEGIYTNGIWRDYMKYEISVYSKYLVLGDEFKITFKLKPFSDFKMCSIESLNVFFVQKLQCEKRSDFTQEDDVFEITNKCPIKQLKPKENKDQMGLKSYDDTWSIKLPKSVPFTVHPFLTEKSPTNDFETQKGLRISHFINIILSVVPLDVNTNSKNEEELINEVLKPTVIPTKHGEVSYNDNHQEVITTQTNSQTIKTNNEGSTILRLKCKVYFKAPVRLLASNAIKQPTPPTYEEAIKKTSKINKPFFLNPFKIVKRHIPFNETYFPPAYTFD